jgi:calcineurin-like phosphoesterase
VVDTEGPFFMCAVCIEIDVATGKSISIQRIRIDDDTLVVSNGKEHD